MSRTGNNPRSGAPKFGVARVLSKLGFCSRSQAWALVREGRVAINGTITRDPECGVHIERDAIQVDGQTIRSTAKVYLMLNKPRGLITTRSDEQGRTTVYECFARENLPWIAPVGRLDKASEGLILFTNDMPWGDRLLSPEQHIDRTYHVQVDSLVSERVLRQWMDGIQVPDGDWLAAKSAHLLRTGSRTAWIEVILDQGKNRQIRRLVEACGMQVLRLIRIAIGQLQLGNLPKGSFRHLTAQEVDWFRSARANSAPGPGQPPLADGKTSTPSRPRRRP